MHALVEAGHISPVEHTTDAHLQGQIELVDEPSVTLHGLMHALAETTHASPGEHQVNCPHWHNSNTTESSRLQRQVLQRQSSLGPPEPPSRPSASKLRAAALKATTGRIAQFIQILIHLNTFKDLQICFTLIYINLIEFLLHLKLF